MQRTVQDFLDHEIEELHKNIDRIQNHMTDKFDSVASSGQSSLLSLQQEHLTLIEGVQNRVRTYHDLMSVCRQNILDNEQRHSKLAYRENTNHAKHSAEWWYTLHLIQFWSDFLSRVQSDQTH